MSSEDEPEAPPPAGGFGEPGAGKRFGLIQPKAKPPLTTGERIFRGVMTFFGAVALVVLGIVVLGMLFGALLYARRNSIDMRRAESINMLGHIAKEAQRRYEERGTLCPTARSIPSMDTAGPYQSRPSEWQSDPGWSCLGVELSHPQAYRYGYESDGTKFTATARPIDGKDTVVREVKGMVVDGKLLVEPSITER